MTSHRVRDEAPISFLSRLRGERPGREPSDDERFAREVAAIARNLSAVLNARKGTGSVIQGFGLGEYDGRLTQGGAVEPHIATKEILAVLLPEIADQVRRFEPRIGEPTVSVLGRDGDLRAAFALRGSVAGRAVRFRLAMHTIFRDFVVEPEGLVLEGGERA